MEDTYEGILLGIDKALAVSAHQILTWLTLCERPLRVKEAVEILSIERYEFHAELRLQDAQDVLNICPNVIKAMPSSKDTNNLDTATLSLAHDSIRDFLLSDRILSSRSASYHIAPAAQTDLVRMCFAYLKHLSKASSVGKTTVTRYPFADYAARYWYAHAKKAEENPDEQNVENYLRALDDFTSHRNIFANSIRLSDPDQSWKLNLEKSEDVIAEPLYYMALTGLKLAVSFLISSKGANVNSRNEYSSAISALGAASREGHDAIVEMLLRHGGLNQNKQATGGENQALRAASQRGHEKVVRLLLEQGAEVNAQGGRYGNALQAASRFGHEKIVELLR